MVLRFPCLALQGHPCSVELVDFTLEHFLPLQREHRPLLILRLTLGFSLQELAFYLLLDVILPFLRGYTREFKRVSSCETIFHWHRRAMRQNKAMRHATPDAHVQTVRTNISHVKLTTLCSCNSLILWLGL